MNFPKELRVRRRFEYLRFFNQSEVKRLDSCIIFRIPNTLNHPRLGVTVKTRSGSVVRNRVKRQVRECFRLNRNNLGSYDYNVVVSNPRDLDFRSAQRVRRSLDSLWSHEARF